MVLSSRLLAASLLGFTALSACSENTATSGALQSGSQVEEARTAGQDSSERAGRSALQADGNPAGIDLAEPGHVAPGENLTDDGEAPMEGGNPSAIDLAEPGYVAPGEDLSDDGEAPMEDGPEAINDVDPVRDGNA